MTIGFRFRPSDREIINDYLIKRMDGHDYSNVIRDIDLCSYEPWELPGISVMEDDEVWYFFCRPEYKYRNSKRANRATRSGFWKPTGKVRPVRGRGGAQIGTKRTLVFHSKTGSGSVSVRTTWVIHEYDVLPGQREFVFCKLKDKSDEQTGSTAVEEAEQDIQAGFDAGCDTTSAAIALGDTAQIQEALDASDAEFDLNSLLATEREALASQGMYGEDWLWANHLLFGSSEDEVDPSFADSLLIEPEECVENFDLPPSDYQPQRPQNQSYLVDVSDKETDVSHGEYLQQLASSRIRMTGMQTQMAVSSGSNVRHASARQFRQASSVQTIYESLPPSNHDVNQSRQKIRNRSTLHSRAVKVRHEPEDPELLLSSGLSAGFSPFQKVSSTRHHQLQAFLATAKSMNQAREYKHGNHLDAKKVFQVREKASVSNTKTSSFTHRNMVPSHQPTPPFTYIVNVIVGLVLLIVVITQMMQFLVCFD